MQLLELEDELDEHDELDELDEHDELDELDEHDELDEECFLHFLQPIVFNRIRKTLSN